MKQWDLQRMTAKRSCVREEEQQYEEICKEEVITYGVIEIHFLYNLTGNAENFLQSVQNQLMMVKA